MSGANIANLMGMAATAERAQNNEEALSYYNRVLEADPTISEAWLGKGRAAGWLSSLAHLRIAETIVAGGHAIGSADEGDKARVADSAAQDATAIITALYGMARRHFEEHRTVDSARTTYVSVSAALIDALADVRRWAPAHVGALEQTVLIARDLLDYGVSDALATVLRQQMDEANAALIALNPDYRAPDLATRTIVQQEQQQAETDLIGYMVAFVIAIVLGLVVAASRS